MIRYRAKVLEVHSGDDMIVMADLNIDGLHKKIRVRLDGVDAPDAYKAAPDTEAGIVRNTVRDLVMRNDCYIDVHKTTPRYWMVTLHAILDGVDTSINKYLADKGYIFSHRKDKNGRAKKENATQAAASA